MSHGYTLVAVATQQGSRGCPFHACSSVNGALLLLLGRDTAGNPLTLPSTPEETTTLFPFFLNNIFIIYEYMLVIEHRKNTRNVLLLLFAGPSESKRY